MPQFPETAHFLRGIARGLYKWTYENYSEQFLLSKLQLLLVLLFLFLGSLLSPQTPIPQPQL